MNEESEKTVMFQTQREDHCKNLPNSLKTKPKTAVSNIIVKVKEIGQKLLKIEGQNDEREPTSII